MGNTRLVEIINREPAETGRQLVLRVNGEEAAIVIDAGRSVNLTIDDSAFVWIGRKIVETIDLPPDIAAFIEGQQWTAEQQAAMAERAGDTAAPTGDETDFDPFAPYTPPDGGRLETVNPVPTADEIEAMLEAERKKNADFAALLDLGGQPDPNAQPADFGLPPADTVTHEDVGTDQTQKDGAPVDAPPATLPTWTRESLAALAFGQLRDIAGGLGLKVRGKEEAIREILAATEGK